MPQFTLIFCDRETAISVRGVVSEWCRIMTIQHAACKRFIELDISASRSATTEPEADPTNLLACACRNLPVHVILPSRCLIARYLAVSL